MDRTIYAEEYRKLLDWLREERKKRGLTMRDMGAKLGVHHSWIGRVEKGERRLDIVEFARVCRTMGCDPYDGMKIVEDSSSKTALQKAAEPRPSYRARKPNPRRP